MALETTTSEPYVPELGYVYPSNPNDYMVEVKIVRDVKLDETYPFLDRSIGFRFKRCLLHLGIFTLLFPLSSLRYGLKIEGKGILRKHRELLKNGAVTVSNHIHRWDFPFVLKAVRYRTMYFPLRRENVNSPDAAFTRLTGGIPVPEDLHSIKYFNHAFDEVHARKKWIHVFPEGSRFTYFQPIRPFKKGVFTMVHRYNLPVIPMAFSYRDPDSGFTFANLIRSLRGKQKLPMITLRIGEPVLLDATLNRKEAVQKLRKDTHEAIVRLAGISDNKYPAEGD